MNKIIRNFLEIKSLDNLIPSNKPTGKARVKLLLPSNFQLNKFLYKQIGKQYHWVDRLAWTNEAWEKYVLKKNLFTYILHVEKEIAGFFELFHHQDKTEVEIIYLGLLNEFIEKKLGGYLLTEAIKIAWSFNINRVWVHTCSLDHSNALNNYLARGMKIFNSRTIYKNIA